MSVSIDLNSVAVQMRAAEIRQRAERVRAEIESARGRRGGTAAVTLVAVTKTFPVEVAAAAMAAGLNDLGESRPQELRDKEPLLGSAARWHFIGPLQRNKVKYVVGRAALIHSLDSWELALAVQERAARQGVVQPVLLQVNIGEEEQKHGFAPAGGDGVGAVAARIAGLEHLRVRGLMTIPPATDAEGARRHFATLAALARELRAGGALPPEARELSMGMSNDFAVAVEEGATLVRVGSALFGPRPAKPPLKPGNPTGT
jgi:pyridoxal phosphate enzyme (YggS family)